MTVLTARTNSKDNDAILRNGFIQNADTMLWYICPDSYKEGKVTVEIGNDRTGLLNGYMTVPVETLVSLSEQLIKHTNRKDLSYNELETENQMLEETIDTLNSTIENLAKSLANAYERIDNYLENAR